LRSFRTLDSKAPRRASSASGMGFKPPSCRRTHSRAFGPCGRS
jgi:hypothetical protein